MMQNSSSPEADFPMVCDTCLGNNPYVRMTKLPFGQKTCKISHLPFQPYRWKAGTQGRYKETIISMVVAKERSICQACLNDIKTGLPVGVRDAVLGQQQQQLQPMYGIVNLQHHYLNQQREQQLFAHSDQSSISSQLISDINQNPPGQQLLMQFAEKKKAADTKHGGTAFRNLPKLCTFWLNGMCQRAKQKTCPYRPCCGVNIFPELLGHAEYRSIAEGLSKRLEEEGADKVQRTLDKDTKQALRTVINAANKNREENIRQRVQGTDDLTKKYLNQMGLGQQDQQLQQQLAPSYTHQIPPTNAQQNHTLWLGNIPQGVEAPELSNILTASFGATPTHIRLVNQPAAMMAFVQYADSHIAAEMLQRMTAPGQAVVVRGVVAKVSWAKQKANNTTNTHQFQQQIPPTAAAYSYLPPPPGMERAPVSRYALPGMAPPMAVRPPPPPGPPPAINASGEELEQVLGKRKREILENDAENGA